MTTQPDRFSVGRTYLAIIDETDDDRSEAFLETLGLSGEGGLFFDKTRHPLVFTKVSTAGLDRYAAAELRRAAQAIVRPIEIRQLWKRDAKGKPLLTRRYIGEVEGVDIAVDINKAGWCFATSEDPGFRMDLVRHGELLYGS